MILLQVRVLVPFVTVRTLNEPHPSFSEAAGQQALSAKVVGRFRADAVEVERLSGFLADVSDAGASVCIRYASS